MITYESKQKRVPISAEQLYTTVSDLTNLEQLLKKADEANVDFPEKERIKGVVQDIEFEKESCSFNVSGLGKISFKITESIPNQRVVLDSTNSPMPLTAKIEIEGVETNESDIRIVLEIDLPPMVKMMVGSKIQSGVDMLAESIGKAVEKKSV